MFYKIENIKCEVYAKLAALRAEEKEIEASNQKILEEKLGGLSYDEFYGNSGQQNFRRVNQYNGFVFKEPEKVDTKIWKALDTSTDLFVPNLRTKVGREMSELLTNGLKGSNYSTPLDILGVTERGGKFIFPFLEVAKNGTIVIFLDNHHKPADENVVEITSVEFYKILNEG